MKSYIKVKRGILSPRHCNEIGASIWLYLYYIDRADWDTGEVFGYTDKTAAADLGKSQHTIRHWRRKLIENNYIVQSRGLHSLKIKVNKWLDPSKNWTSHTGNELPVSSHTGNHKGNELPEYIGNNPSNEITDIYSLPESESINIKKDSDIFNLYHNNIGFITPILKDKLIDAEKEYTEDWIIRAIEISVEREARNWSYIEAILKNWKQNGFGNNGSNKKGRNNDSTKESTKEPTYTPEQHAAAEKIARRNVERLRANR